LRYGFSNAPARETNSPRVQDALTSGPHTFKAMACVYKAAIGIRFLGVPPRFLCMCLAIPGKVLEIRGNAARVDFGHGATREVDVTLVDVREGQYVLVHVGYAIQVLEEDEAEETLKLWREILASMEPGARERRGE